MKIYFTKESANGDPEDLTPEKRYETIGTEYCGTYCIVDDAGEDIRIALKDCAHLGFGTWLVEDDNNEK